MLRPAYRFVRKIIKHSLRRAANLFDPPVIVLIYHRVTLLQSDPQLLAVSPSNFSQHLEIIKKNYPIIRFDEDWTGLKQPSVVITFDDGYADNYLEALPVLEKHGVPATFFVSSGYVGSSVEYWWDELERIIILPEKVPNRFELDDAVFGRSWPTGTLEERIVFYNGLHPLMKQVDADIRDTWLKQLRNWAVLDSNGRTSHRAMTLEQLTAMADHPLVTIGAHTQTHTALSSQSPERQWEELSESKTALEHWLNRNVSVFSYPFGGLRDYTQGTVELVKKAGYKKAASNFPGQAHTWTDMCQIPRHLVRNWDGRTFESQLRNFWKV